jgi:hypothetical protein
MGTFTYRFVRDPKVTRFCGELDCLGGPTPASRGRDDNAGERLQRRLAS